MKRTTHKRPIPPSPSADSAVARTSTRIVARLYSVAVCSGFQNSARRKQSMHSSSSPRAYHIFLGHSTTQRANRFVRTKDQEVLTSPSEGSATPPCERCCCGERRTRGRSTHSQAAHGARVVRGMAVVSAPCCRWGDAPSTPCVSNATHERSRPEGGDGGGDGGRVSCPRVHNNR